MSSDFDYQRAFVRNVGWLTEGEQLLLKSRKVAIGGLGGVGGSHLLTLVRLGIGSFHLSDFDSFGIENFNRQAGASTDSIGRPKLEVMVEKALSINPELSIKSFPDGIDVDNVHAFLDDVDVYVDGLDFFALPIRRVVFAECYRRSIPVVTVAPIGMGAALLNFLPGKMSAEDYFCFGGVSEEEQYLRFYAGLAPAGLSRGYLVDSSRVNFAEKRGPSTIMACELCAGVASTQVLKLLLKRGPVLAAPTGMQFDAYTNRCVKTWRPGGNNNLIQKLALSIGRRQLKGLSKQSSETSSLIPIVTNVEKVLDLARWAPSGDNTQPWRFEIINNNEFVIHGNDTRETIVYDLDGRASQLAIGALLESVDLASSSLGLKATIVQQADSPEHMPTFTVKLSTAPLVTADPLVAFLKVRSTQRRSMSMRALSEEEKSRLEGSLPPGFSIRWFGTPALRWEAAKLMFNNAKVRLTMPEAYAVHREIIEWGVQFSKDRIPEPAVGVDPVTAKLMKWVMASWDRVCFMNRFLMGTLPPRLQLDLVPGVRCGAHFAIVADDRPREMSDFLSGGRAMQRLWLTAARLGLGFQPEMTPLIFSRYVDEGRTFTADKTVAKLAEQCADQFSSLLGADANNVVFMGRLGDSPLPVSRSIRLGLEKLLIDESSSQRNS